jgi:hypothetical protein
MWALPIYFAMLSKEMLIVSHKIGTRLTHFLIPVIALWMRTATFSELLTVQRGDFLENGEICKLLACN